MISRLVSGLAIGFLLSGKYHAQAVRGAIKKEGALVPSANDSGFQNVIDQLENKSVQHTAGLRVVVVYEQPSDCPVANIDYSGKGGFNADSKGQVMAGGFAVSMVANLGIASTKTIFTDGATTSVTFDSTPTPVSMTQDNPIYTLVPEKGPDAIIINDWTFSASMVAGVEFRQGASTSAVNGMSGSTKDTSGANGLTNQSVQSAPKSVTLRSEATCLNEDNLFAPISNVSPKDFFDEGVHPFEILPGVSNDLPYQTNKFYGNLFAGEQNSAAFVWPYMVKWERQDRYGFSVQYTKSSRREFGDKGVKGAPKYYFNPINVPGVSIGAVSIKKDHNHMTVSRMRQMSVNVKISPEISQSTDYIEFPIVEGMGVVTSIYRGSLIAQIEGNGGISNFTEIEYEPSEPLTKMYRIVVGTQETWLVIVKFPASDPDFTLKEGADKKFLVGSKAVDGLIIQVALAPSEDEEKYQALYYQIAGQYVTDAKLSGSMSCGHVNYKIAYETAEIGDTPLVFALQHHLALFDDEMKKRDSNIKLESTTKGTMHGYLTKELLFSHEVDTKVQWLPYVKDRSTDLTYSSEQIEQIRKAAIEELGNVSISSVVMKEGTQYLLGKAVDKYAYMMYVLHDIVNDVVLADKVLVALKSFFESYRAHKIKLPLFYDTKMKGVTSRSAFIGFEAESGSGFYSGHNFHYAYMIHAAALVGYIDGLKGGSWAEDNKEFINMLVRDVANPSEDDEFFPVSRSFDWFHGHSWTQGLSAVQDGKELASASEDVHFSYAMKMWGKVIKDTAMEARGDLMLSIQTESFNSYFFYKDGNKVVPQRMVSNKIAGILFENKIDYTTWFGSTPEERHGVQMIPMTPALGSVRSAEFAKQEWDSILHDVSTDERTSRWAGVLNINRVFFDASSAWKYFASPDFDVARDMDGGQSRAWALAYAAPFVNEANGGVN
ncbi:hypothetical protein OXX59_007612 [Metschnikowia pulcherrima]